MATEAETSPNTTRIGAEHGASLTTVSVPLVLDISSAQLDRLPERHRAIVDLISTTALETLTRWDHLTFQLPRTEFVQDHSSGHTLEPLVGVVDLCIQPDETDEMIEITIDPETGDRRRITAEQYRDIVQNGRFSFPSRQFPHINHVWQLPSWMVRGRNNIAKDFHRRLGYSLDHLVVYCPNRIYQKPNMWKRNSLSIAGGIRGIVRRMKGIIALLIGLPETVPNRMEYKYRKQAEKQYVRQKCAPSELEDFSYYFDSIPDHVKHYTRYGEDESAYDDTYRLAALQAFQDVSPDDLSTFERISHIGRKFEEQQRIEEIQRVTENEADEQKRSLLVEFVRAQHIIKDGNAKLQARSERERDRLIAEARRKHPILSLSHEWLQRWLTKHGVQHYDEWQHEQEVENITLMRSNDLHRAAKFEQSKLQFQREVWPELRASWLRDRVATREYEHTYFVFSPRQWREGGESDVRLVQTSTTYVGWRLALLWRDMMSFLRAGVYCTVITNLWRGPLGIQALFRLDDIPHSWEVRDNGDVHPNEFRLSMYTRLRAIWRRVRELRATFEEGEDTVFGRDAVRWLHFITNYGIRGGVGTALVIIGQPLLTVLNIAFTGIFTATAVVWAPLSALFAYCTSWLIYDWRSFHRFSVVYWEFDNWSDVFMRVSIERSPKLLPVISELLGGILGALECCIGVIGLGFHPIYSLLRSTLACVQGGVRMIWDSMWNRALRRFGRWPARDSFLAQRVSGVGISGSYYFRLSTELVTRCVLARLEQIELHEARRIIESAVAKPRKEMENFINDVVTGVCTQPGPWGETMAKLQRDEEWRLKNVHIEFEKREKLLRRLTEMPLAKERIRPEKGVEVEVVLQQCEEMVEKFCNERIARLGNVSTDVWRRAGATPGDFKTLTKYLLGELFSEEFLTPLETTEETLEIAVTFDDLVNVDGRNLGRRGQGEGRDMNTYFGEMQIP